MPFARRIAKGLGNECGIAVGFFKAGFGAAIPTEVLSDVIAVVTVLPMLATR
jgi:hypothetical protein